MVRVSERSCVSCKPLILILVITPLLPTKWWHHTCTTRDLTRLQALLCRRHSASCQMADSWRRRSLLNTTSTALSWRWSLARTPHPFGKLGLLSTWVTPRFVRTHCWSNIITNPLSGPFRKSILLLSFKTVSQTPPKRLKL